MQSFPHLIALFKQFLLLGMPFAAQPTPTHPSKPSSSMPPLESPPCLSGSWVLPLPHMAPRHVRLGSLLLHPPDCEQLEGKKCIFHTFLALSLNPAGSHYVDLGSLGHLSPFGTEPEGIKPEWGSQEGGQCGLHGQLSLWRKEGQPSPLYLCLHRHFSPARPRPCHQPVCRGCTE